ncbi:MAG: putative transporter [Bacteroidales bacterium]|nr:putative transporter [Bacteroidales bacterium]
MRDLFYGTGVAHSIMLVALVIGVGLYLGRFKFKGISLGSTWILFFGILMGHLGFRANADILNFVKEFGLILFVFSIGLQVGPGFFHSFRSGGVKMNLLAVMNILLAVGVTYAISAITGEDLRTMVGVMSGAVTNTPGLGAAQQTLVDVSVASGMDAASAGASAASLASAYAVAYPIGVLGVILVILLWKAVLRIDHNKEKEAIKAAEESSDNARRMHVAVENPAIFGKKLFDVIKGFNEGDFVVSRVMHGDQIFIPDGETVLQEGDRLLLVTSQSYVDNLRILFGEEVPMHQKDWLEKDHHIVTRRIVITNSKLTGKTLRQMHIRSAYQVSVTRVIRAGVELVASPDLYVQMGDGLMCVGTEKSINHLASLVGNSNDTLNKPNLVPIFIGIVVGIIFGSIPIHFPGIPQAIKLGLAGGPLIIAILLGHFGPKYRITTYVTTSANLMLREMGISLFLAAVGIGAGANFWSSIVGGGYWWILYGALITIVPLCLTFVISRLAFKLNFYQILGLISGSCTNPPVLAFAQGMYGSEYTSVNYATVYPLSMFMRVLVAQVLVLMAL